MGEGGGGWGGGEFEDFNGVCTRLSGLLAAQLWDCKDMMTEAGLNWNLYKAHLQQTNKKMKKKKKKKLFLLNTLCDVSRTEFARDPNRYFHLTDTTGLTETYLPA